MVSEYLQQMNDHKSDKSDRSQQALGVATRSVFFTFCGLGTDQISIQKVDILKTQLASQEIPAVL